MALGDRADERGSTSVEVPSRRLGRRRVVSPRYDRIGRGSDDFDRKGRRPRSFSHRDESARGDTKPKSSNRANDNVGRRCGGAAENGARWRTTTRRCALDKVGGADKRRRARGSALARRRRVSSGEQARRWQSSNGAEREDDVGRRAAERPERRTLRTTTRSVRARRRSAALTSNDVLAARRWLAVVVSVRSEQARRGHSTARRTRHESACACVDGATEHHRRSTGHSKSSSTIIGARGIPSPRAPS